MTRCTREKLLFGAGLLLAAGLFAGLAPRVLTPQVWGVEDYVAFWSGARLHLTGGDPWLGEEVLALENQVGWPNPYALVMWNPPWTLTYLVAFVPTTFRSFSAAFTICLSAA